MIGKEEVGGLMLGGDVRSSETTNSGNSSETTNSREQKNKISKIRVIEFSY